MGFFGMLKGMSKSDAEEEGAKYIGMLNLEAKKNVNVTTLFGGMKRKVNLGIALIGNSKVVMLDEPTSGMDPGPVEACGTCSPHSRATAPSYSPPTSWRSSIYPSNHMNYPSALPYVMGVSRIGLSVTTMDDVFLKIGEMIEAKDHNVAAGGGEGGTAAWTSDPEAETRSLKISFLLLLSSYTENRILPFNK